MELTEAQQRVVDAPGPLVVEGQPGWGRTTALVARAASALDSGSIVPERLLYLTRDAAEARRVRMAIVSRVGRSLPEPTVITPAGLAATLLRRLAPMPVRILSSGEARAVVARLLDDEPDDLWPGFAASRRRGPGFGDALAALCRDAQRRGLSADALEQALTAAGRPAWVPAARFYGRMLDALQGDGAVDPSGLVMAAAALPGALLADRFDMIVADDAEAAAPAVDRLLTALDTSGRATAMAWSPPLAGPAAPWALQRRIGAGETVVLDRSLRASGHLTDAVAALAAGGQAEAGPGLEVHLCGQPRDEGEVITAALADEARRGTAYGAMAVIGRPDSLDAVERLLGRFGLPARRDGAIRVADHWALRPVLEALEARANGTDHPLLDGLDLSIPPDRLCHRLWLITPALAEARSTALNHDPRAHGVLDAALALVGFAQEITARRPDAPLGELLEALRAEDGPVVAAPRRDAVALLTAAEVGSREFEVVAVVGATDSAYPGGRGGVGLFDMRVLDLDGPVAVARAEVTAGRARLVRAISRARRRVIVTASVDIRGRARLTRFVAAPTTIPSPPPIHLARGDARRVAGSPALDEATRLGAARFLRHAGADTARWWGVHEWTAGGPISVDPLSYSAIASYAACPLQFLFEKRLGFDDVRSHYSDYGTLVHDLLRDVTAGVIAETDIVDEFERRFDPTRFPTGPVAEQFRRDGRAALAALTQWPEWQRHRVVKPEASFAVTIAGARVTGRIDRVDEIAPGLLRVVDYKTGRKPSDDAQLDDLLDQLRLYLLAVARDEVLRELGEPVAAALWYLEPGGPQAVRERLPEQAEARVEARIAAVVAGIAEGRFAPTPAPETCRRCAYHHLCPTRAPGQELLEVTPL